jgi:hypothetical protein
MNRARPTTTRREERHSERVGRRWCTRAEPTTAKSRPITKRGSTRASAARRRARNWKTNPPTSMRLPSIHRPERSRRRMSPGRMETAAGWSLAAACWSTEETA